MQTFSAKQKEALKLLHSDAKHIMLFGGRRSGKSHAIVSDMVSKALRFKDARMLIGRAHLSHLVSSIWEQTLPDILKSYSDTYKLNRKEHDVNFFNGSKISLVGYDDKERIEKNLGREFCIVFNNECSTISYDAVLLAQSSLAQNIPGLKNKMYYDQNPPAPTHWTHKLFEEHVQPKTGKLVGNPEEYVSLLLNPMDNPYLSSDYIGSTLDALPERERRRYKFGEYVKVKGAVYDKFSLSEHSLDINDLPQIEYFIVGLDFGLNMAAVLCGFAGENVYVLDEYTAYNMTASEFNSQVYYKWGQYNYIAYCDPSGGERLGEIANSVKADNSVEAGINYVSQKIENKQFFIINDGGPNTPQLVAEIDSYHYDDKGRIVKAEDHLVDSARYAIYSHAKYGGSILIQETA